MDAARAYDKAARRIHGPYAICNFPDEVPGDEEGGGGGGEGEAAVGGPSDPLSAPISPERAAAEEAARSLMEAAAGRPLADLKEEAAAEAPPARARS